MSRDVPADLPMGDWVREKVGLVLEELARIADIAKDPETPAWYKRNLRQSLFPAFANGLKVLLWSYDRTDDWTPDLCRQPAEHGTLGLAALLNGLDIEHGLRVGEPSVDPDDDEDREPTSIPVDSKPSENPWAESTRQWVMRITMQRLSDETIPANERRKIALFCNVKPERVIEARDVDTIYQVPIAYHDHGFDREVCRYFGLDAEHEPNLDRWRGVVRSVREPEGKVTIAVVGKYTVLLDAYKSLSEALTHGGFGSNVKVGLEWMDSEIFERDDAVSHLEHVNGILVPGGFGERGTEGKIHAVKFARERKVPFFGICFGMQMAVIEAARNLLGIEDASSSEFGSTEHAVVAELLASTTQTAQYIAKHGSFALRAHPELLEILAALREQALPCRITSVEMNALCVEEPDDICGDGPCLRGPQGHSLAVRRRHDALPDRGTQRPPTVWLAALGFPIRCAPSPTI
jgi:anthranilate/para-aminobenzoate synthase component II